MRESRTGAKMSILFINKGKPFHMGAFTNKNYGFRLGDSPSKVSFKIDFSTKQGAGQLEIFLDEIDIDYLAARQTEIGRKLDYKKKDEWAQKHWGLESNPFSPDKNQPIRKVKKDRVI